MFKPKMGVSIANLTEHLTDEWIDGFSNSRIETIEIFARRFVPENYPNSRPQLAKLLNNSKIKVSSIHAQYGVPMDLSRLGEDLHLGAVAFFKQYAIGLATEFHVPIIVTHMGFEGIPPQERAARFQMARRSIDELTQPLRDAGIVLALEVISATAMGDCVEEVLAIREGSDEKIFKVCLDFNHVKQRYPELPELVRKLGPRLAAIHISDYDGENEKHWFPGKGVIAWKGVMHALRDIDYQGPFTMEIIPLGDTIPEKIKKFEETYDWLLSL